MIKALIFDVDGTLLDTERIYIKAWQEAGIAHGYPIPMEALMKTRAVNAAVAKACYQEYCGQDFPFEQIRDTRIEIAERIIGEASADTLLKPYAPEILQWAKAQGLVIAAASSTSYAKSVEHLQHAGLAEYFSVIIGGNMVQRGKPNPDIFLLAAQQADAQPQECLVVGDSPADVLAASAAGMPVILIPDQVPANDQTTALSYKVLDNLGGLSAVVVELNK